MPSTNPLLSNIEHMSSDAHERSAHAAADAARAMQHTNSWQPSFQRRQSWSKEDQKRELQMSTINDAAKTGPGFTERS
jgi:hypothetical protein